MKHLFHTGVKIPNKVNVKHRNMVVCVTLTLGHLSSIEKCVGTDQ